MRRKISAAVIAKNAEKTVGNTIRSLKWCDEIVVIDDYSSDETSAIAKKLGARVIKNTLNNNFANQRNFALGKASSKWVLFLDADEICSNELKNEIIKAISNPSYDGYYLKRIDIWLGKKLLHGEAGNVLLLRLGKRDAGKWKRKVHEYWDIKNAGRLTNPIIHYPHPGVHGFIRQIASLSSHHAIENEKEGKRATIFKILMFPAAKFLRSFIIKKGYRDGVHGFLYAAIMSWHSFLAWSMQWLNQRK